MTTLDNNSSNEMYEIRMAGCGHRHIWDVRRIASADETRFDLETGMKQDYYICSKCASPRENGVTNYCMSSVLHKVLRARKLAPLEEKRIITI
jgi:hypothetical protein